MIREKQCITITLKALSKSVENDKMEKADKR